MDEARHKGSHMESQMSAGSASRKEIHESETKTEASMSRASSDSHAESGFGSSTSVVGTTTTHSASAVKVMRAGRVGGICL